MKVEKSIWDKFTNRYQVSKTLRFELRPIGKTEKRIQEAGIIGVEGGKLQGKDAVRAEEYKIMKKLLDEGHRRHIEKSLSESNVTQFFKKKDFENLYEGFSTIRSLKKKGRNLEEKEKKQIKGEEKQYKETKSKMLKTLEKLFKEQKGSDLTDGKKGIKYLKCEVSEGRLYNTEDERIEIIVDSKEKSLTREEAVGYCENFEKFTTYFVGFNENRKNVYDCSKDPKKTSIAHRIFEENIEFHFENIIHWENLQKTIQELKKSKEDKEKEAANFFSEKIQELEKRFGISLKDFFKPGFFGKCFSQGGIDDYNMILGGKEAKVGSEKEQGLNEVINLSRQQAGGEGRNFPRMQELYKQILSEREKEFVDTIDDDRELLREIREFGKKVFLKKDKGRDLLDEFQGDVKEHLGSLKEKELTEHFLRREAVRNFSIELCGNWDALDHCWEKVIDDELHSKKIKKKEAETLRKKEILSFEELNRILDYAKGLDRDEEEDNSKGFTKKFRDLPTEKILPCYINQRMGEHINKEQQDEGSKRDTKGHGSSEEKVSIRRAWAELKKEKLLDCEELSKGKERKKQIELIKSFLDACSDLFRFAKDLSIKDKELKHNVVNPDWKRILDKFSQEFNVLELYNKARNYITKKDYALDKVKLNFEKATLGDGWDENKESDNLCVLFLKEDQYYLGIMKKDCKDLFNRRKKEDSFITDYCIKEDILVKEDKAHYKKIIYKQIPGPNKMLPKVFFSKKRRDTFKPSKEIDAIYNSKSAYKNSGKSPFNQDDCHKLIDFYKDSIEKHPSWKKYNFKFSETKDYEDMSEFFAELDSQAYKIDFCCIDEGHINKAVEDGKLYLFQIYNKDFSTKSKGKGRPNLHTQYWRLLFAEENLKDVVLKLSGGAELFFRKASLKKIKPTHPKNKEIKNKSPLNGKKKSKFPYDLIKDRRFTENKYFFHVPIELNFKSKETKGTKLNEEILSFLNKNKKVNVIGIDRGERHLLYYSIIDQDARIIKQGTLNEIRGKDYQSLLDRKEKERDAARKNWATIENIKELKAGYLSLVVHELAKLIIKHNAIVVLEDLNIGFKRGRFKVEKQVYQKFERALIQKLNYLVFKDREKRKEAGHYLNAYQLTDEFKSFQELGKQSGILFYTVASYTSKTDPVSGFMRGGRIYYSNVEEAVKFWSSFDTICYNNKEKRFEFSSFDVPPSKPVSYNNKEKRFEFSYTEKSGAKWTICSHVSRSYYTKGSGTTHIPNVTEEISKLLDDHGIDYKTNADLQKVLQDRRDKKHSKLHKEMIWLYNLLLNMRVTYKENDKEYDYIFSPVEPFFDSRKYEKRYEKKKEDASLPIDSDANGAYNIARKGLLMLKQISNNNNGDKVKIDGIDKKKWQKYVQSEETVKFQKKLAVIDVD